MFRFDISSYILLIAAFIPLLCCGVEIINLERAVPLSGIANLTHLVHRDRVRHGRLLRSVSDGAIGYTLGGTGDLSLGLYYTRLQVGTPPREYHLQVDTGSDLTWISCVPCKNCPTSTGIPNISLHHYDPAASSTYSALSCYEDRCPTGIRASRSDCLADNAHYCRYWIEYGDHSHVNGYYVQELITYDRNVGSSHTMTSTAPFVFGCATAESGFSISRSTDGILGLGHFGISMISQFAIQGLSPKVFSHCLRGDKEGGGILILGEVAESDIIYIPLISSQPHYNLDLQAISVNGKILPIDPHLLSGSVERGVLVDLGTTLMYLQLEALTQLLSAINASTSSFLIQSPINRPCYLLTSKSIAEAFPQVSLHFAGDAKLVIGPDDYLIYEGLLDGSQLWCTGFEVAENGQSILGDLVMKNRLFIYDLAGQRIGWKNHDCSAPVNISTEPKHGRRSNADRSSMPTLVSWLLFILLHHIL